MPEAPWPRCISAENGPWPLHGIEASRRIEAAAAAGVPAMTLMHRAGLATARLARAIAPLAERIDIWCGPGNNGGDGYVAARHLHQWGARVRVQTVGEAGALPEDAARARQEAIEAGVRIEPGTDAAAEDTQRPAQLVIDALLGLGASRAPAGALAAAIEAIGRQSTPVLAVDVPSALHAERGCPLGARAVRADVTLALLTLKPGLFTAHGRDHAGEVWFDPLASASKGQAGAAASGADPDAWLNSTPPLARLDPTSHKGSRGDVLVIGGAPGMVGAAWLAARSALAAGAGRVYLGTLAQAEDRNAFDLCRPELMRRDAPWTDRTLLERCTVVCGCGGGRAVRAALPEVLLRAARLVLDADALNEIASERALATLLAGRLGRGQATIATPHPLEAARLLRSEVSQVQGDRLAAATRLAGELRLCAVLKGSGTVLAMPGRAPRINSTGNAALASAGTGDVLAGWIGGQWAQRRDREAALEAAFDTASAAVWQHGRAADLYRAPPSRRPLLANDLIEAMSSLG